MTEDTISMSGVKIKCKRKISYNKDNFKGNVGNVVWKWRGKMP